MWDRNHQTPALEGCWRHLIAHNCLFVEGHPSFPSKTLLKKKNLAAIKITHFLNSLYFTCRNGVCIKLILWWFYRWDYTPCFLYPIDKFHLKEKKIDGGLDTAGKKSFLFNEGSNFHTYTCTISCTYSYAYCHYTWTAAQIHTHACTTCITIHMHTRQTYIRMKMHTIIHILHT